MPEDLKIVVVPKELYYHEVDYVRGLETAARAMLAALQTTRLQLHVALAGKEALSIEKQLSIVDAAIAQAEAAGIKAEG
jgi:hypothetical protein